MATEHLEGHPIHALSVLPPVEGSGAGFAVRPVFGLDGQDEQDVMFSAEAVAGGGHEPDCDAALCALAD